MYVRSVSDTVHEDGVCTVASPVFCSELLRYLHKWKLIHSKNYSIVPLRERFSFIHVFNDRWWQDNSKVYVVFVEWTGWVERRSIKPKPLPFSSSIFFRNGANIWGCQESFGKGPKIWDTIICWVSIEKYTTSHWQKNKQTRSHLILVTLKWREYKQRRFRSYHGPGTTCHWPDKTYVLKSSIKNTNTNTSVTSLLQDVKISRTTPPSEHRSGYIHVKL